VVTYDPDQLRRFLELWHREGGRLSIDQMKALAEWQETPEDVREALMPAIERARRHAARAVPAPLTPAQTEYGREHGLIDEPRLESPSPLQRVAAAIRRAFSPKR